jgi:hypothetical protein
MIQTIHKWRLICCVAALAALFLSIKLFGQFQSHHFVTRRSIMAAADIQHAAGFCYTWHVPLDLRVAPWHQAGLQLREDGKPLPLRVDDRTTVETQGLGRFGAAPFAVGAEQREYVWFSASDNSSPLTNGRKYELQIERPTYRGIIWSFALFLIAGLLGLIALPGKLWLGAYKAVVNPGLQRVRSVRMLAIGLALCAGCALAQTWAGTRFEWKVALQPSIWVYESGDIFYCRLSRWIPHPGYGVIYEKSKALEPNNDALKKSGTTTGSYSIASYHPPSVKIRTSDGTNPAHNGRTYTLGVPIIPPTFVVIAIALGMACVSLLLWAYAKRFMDSWFAGAMDVTGQIDLFLREPRWRWILLMVCLFKLWMVAGAEVTGMSYDAECYANQVVDGIWGGHVMPWHPSGFPAIASIVGQFGLPWRLAVEILYITACAYLAAVMIPVLQSRLAALALYIAMVMHPWGICRFGYFLSEPLFLVCSVALVATMVRAIQQPSAVWSWKLFVGMGGILFLWDWCRPEGPLVYASYGFFACLVLVLAKIKRTAIYWRQIFILMLPVLMLFLGSITIKIINYCHYGGYAKCACTSAPMISLMKAFYRIKPERLIRFAPVTRQSMEAALQVSSALRRYQRGLLDTNAVEVIHGEMITGVSGECGPFFINLLYNAALGSGASWENMRVAESEINQALHDGRLPQRKALYPIDPQWQLWVPELPASFVNCLRMGTSLNSLSPYPCESEVHRYLFDVAANRRVTGVDPRMIIAEGKVHSRSGNVDSVALTDHHGRLLASSPLSVWSPSPLATNMDHNLYGFCIQTPYLERCIDYGVLFAYQGTFAHPENGRDVRIKAGDSYTNHTVAAETGARIDCSGSIAEVASAKEGRLARWRQRVEAHYPTMVWFAVLLAALTSVVARSAGSVRSGSLIACLIFVLGLIVGRSAFYALLDVNMRVGSERYMNCISPLFVVLLFLTAAVLGRILRGSLIDRRST